MATPQKIESLEGALVIDYVRNTVSFRLIVHDLITGEFQLPLAPLDIDIARQLTKI